MVPSVKMRILMEDEEGLLIMGGLDSSLLTGHLEGDSREILWQR